MRIKDAGRQAFTLIELMIVVIIVAILAAAAVPMYNSFTSRAYGTEVQTALSTLRTAQRTYKAEKGTYANAKSELVNAGYISQDDFSDMKYVRYDELSVSDSNPIATWTAASDSELKDAYDYDTVSMADDGTLTKGSST